ncbi:hypothetical protein CEQ90_18295 [Lewinellaceae bacterium SD302]|nr:hypothetical protein CEQ90_18295 [Lewinellaceae bacterium SD302]
MYLLASQLSAQAGGKQCEVNRAELNIYGDNNGTVIQATTANIQRIDCPNGGCVVATGEALMIIQGFLQQEFEPRNKISAIAPVNRLSLAQELVSQLPDDMEICVKDFANDRLLTSNFQVYEAEEKSFKVLVLPVSESDLADYGLQIRYPAKEGIARVWRLGQYYYVNEGTDECLTPANFGNGCERYAFAEDFSGGTAIVGSTGGEVMYWLIGSKGKKISDKFESITSAPNNSPLFVGIKNSLTYLLDRRGKTIGGPYSSLEALDKYILASRTPSEFNLLDNNGFLVLPASYSNINLIGKDFLAVQNEIQTQLLDIKDNFRSIHKIKGKATYRRQGRFFIVKVGLKEGLFDPMNKKVGFPPTYAEIHNLDEHKILVSTYEKLGRSSIRKQKFVDLKGKDISAAYDRIEWDEDSKGYHKTTHYNVNGTHTMYGYIYDNGSKVLPGLYTYLGDFDENFDVAWVADNIPPKRTGILYRDGKTKLYSFNELPTVTALFDSEFYTPFDPATGTSRYRFSALSGDEPYIGLMSAKAGLLTPKATDNLYADQGPPLSISPISEGVFRCEYIGQTSSNKVTLLFNSNGPLSPVMTDLTVVNENWLFGKIRDSYSSNWLLLKYNNEDNNRDSLAFSSIQSAISEDAPFAPALNRPILKVKTLDDEYQMIFFQPDGSLHLLDNYKNYSQFTCDYTYARCESGRTVFIDTLGNTSDCLPFEVHHMAPTQYHSYAIVKKGYHQYGLYDVENNEFGLPMGLSTISYDHNEEKFSATFRNKSFTFQDLGRPILSFIDGDLAAFKAALRNH